VQGTPTDFWGKLDATAGTWLRLMDHCCDVAMVCEALLHRTLLGKRLATLAGWTDLDKVTAARLGVLAALHDVGKFNHGFQNKALLTMPFQAGHVPTAGHVNEARALIEQQDGVIAPVLGLIDDWGDAGWGLLLAAISHHGRPASQEQAWQPVLWRPSQGRDPKAGIERLAVCCRTWFPVAFTAGPSLPQAPEFQHAFAGLVMLADWIGSDRAVFTFSDEDGDRADFARCKASELVAALHLDLESARASLHGRAVDIAALLHPHLPRPLQEVVGDAGLPAPGTVEVLEAETGSGKTEAAYLRFLQLHQAGLVDGLYFALPTRTAATQLHERLVKLTARMFPEREADRPPVVLAVPGYLQVDDAVGKRENADGKKLDDWQVLWNDRDPNGAKARKWAAEGPKRYLAAAIAVGTIDQVLLAALQVEHAHLRATALLRQLLVVDEVHASDAYMGAILQHVLKWHTKAGGHALLLSATLGDAMRRKLTATGPEVSLQVAVATPYPLFTSGKQGSPIAQQGPGKAVAMVTLPWMGDADGVADLAATAARAGAKVLIIRNTVAACIETQRAVEAKLADRRDLLFRIGDVAAPHHSRFAREDRILLDQAIERGFGKDSLRGQGCVAVATQTVQQSLDLDADLLLTDLCPVDVLLQRIGRLHRHERKDRPKGYTEACAVVLVPEDRDLGAMIREKTGEVRGPAGLGSVYDDLRVIEATWRQIEAKPMWRIPAMNRELVELATHPEALRAIVAATQGTAFSAGWRKHDQHCIGGISALRSQAHVVKLPWNDPLEDNAFPSHELREVRTRLGADDRVVELSRPTPGPFGRPVVRLNVPGWLAVAVPAAAAVVDTIALDGSLRIEYGSLTLRYDRLGLRPVQAGDDGGLDG
jgi:CRISPR-associated endonuclease/helicase Cas3